MSEKPPVAVVIAGPNGAGKSTTAPTLLRDTMHVSTFVNADTIAQGLAGFDPDQAAFAAGRVMLEQLKDLVLTRQDFAFETTLASRSFARFLTNARQSGYQCHLLFLWLPSADLAVNRVRQRVQQGGHFVPEDVIRRRYESGLSNFFRLYRPIATRWCFYDNSAPPAPRIISSGDVDRVEVFDEILWAELEETYDRVD